MGQSYKARLLENDLSNIALRIEDMPAHPKYTDAWQHVEAAKRAISEAAAEIHQRGIAKSHDIHRKKGNHP